MRRLFHQWEHGREPGETNPPPGDEGDSETGDGGWDTDPSHEDWQEEVQHPDPEEHDEGDYAAP